MLPNANRNRWPCPGEAKPFLTRSRTPARLMGVLGPVEVLPAAMGHRRHKRAGSDLTAGQPVGDNHPRQVSQTLAQLTENRLAATALRRDCTKMSSTLPCWSMARHR